MSAAASFFDVLPCLAEDLRSAINRLENKGFKVDLSQTGTDPCELVREVSHFRSLKSAGQERRKLLCSFFFFFFNLSFVLQVKSPLINACSCLRV